MQTVLVEDIRECGRTAYYDVDVSVTGKRETFRFEVEGHGIVSRYPDTLDFEAFTHGYPMGRHLASLLCNVHRGEVVTFPVDLLEYGVALQRKRDATSSAGELPDPIDARPLLAPSRGRTA